MNIIGISALSLTLIFFIVNLYLISKKVDKDSDTESKIKETPEGVNINGNILVGEDINSVGNITSQKNISAKGNVFIDGNLKSNSHILAANITSDGSISTYSIGAKNITSDDTISANSIRAKSIETSENIKSANNISANSIGAKSIGANSIETSGNIESKGNIFIDGNIESKGNIKAYDFYSERNLNSGLDISAKGNAFIDGNIDSKGSINSVENISSDKEVYARNFILQNKENDVVINNKHVLAVGEDNKIYKNNELWSDSHNTLSNWAIPLEDDIKPFENFLKDSTNKIPQLRIIQCEPNQYLCGIKTIYGQKDSDKKILLNINAKCCNFPEGFPKSTKS